MPLSTADVMKLYKDAGKRAKDKYIAKVNATDVNPMAEAVKKEATLKQRFNEAIDSGKWRGALLRADPAAWKQRTMTKGADNFAKSFDYTSPAQIAFLDYWLPKMQQLKATVRAMPNATESERDARSDMARKLAREAAKARIGGMSY